jgi:hypothetical protein
VKPFRFFLLFCLPAFLLNPTPSYASESKVYYLETGQELFIPRDESGLINPWEYFDGQIILTHLNGYIDHVFGFIDLLIDIDFLQSLCDEETERLIDFVIFIVRFSVPKSRPDLAEKYEQEIAELLKLIYGEEEYELSSNHTTYWEFVPAICYEKPEFILCKKHKKGGPWNQVKRKAKHFGHWCKKHKKPLIAVGAVAGVFAVAALTGGVGASSAVAAGGALAGLAADDTPPPHVNKPGEVYFHGDSLEPPHLPTYSLPPSNSTTALPGEGSLSPQQNFATIPSELIADHEAFTEEIELVKEQILEANTSFDASPENAKEIAPDFAAQQLKKTMELIMVSIEENMEKPELKSAEFITPGGTGKTVSRIDAVASRVLGLTTRTTTGIGTAAIGEALTNTGSSLSSNFDFDRGDLPIDRLIEAGKEPDRKELTKAGRALAKHGNRPDSIFSKPTGTPAQINQQGQAILEQILNHPEKCISYHTHPELGKNN